MTERLRIVPHEPTTDQMNAGYIHLTGFVRPAEAKQIARNLYRDMVFAAPRPKRGGLTRRQRRVLEVVTEWIDAKGMAPTVREIAALLGEKEHSGCWRVLRTLKRKGVVDIGPGHREIEILRRPEEI